MRQSRRRSSQHAVVAFTAAFTCSLHFLVLSSSNGLVVFPSSIGFLGGRSLSMRPTGYDKTDDRNSGCLSASVPKDVEATNWSRTANGSDKSGVRSRVKSVLEKARRRTKIDTSSDWESSGGLPSADASSMPAFEILDDAVSLGSNISNSETDGSSSRQGSKSYDPNSEGIQSETQTSRSKSDSRVRQADAETINASVQVAPRPFSLPKLTSQQEAMLKSGERVQYQKDMGREGSGYVVLDVDAPPDVVWDCLLDFHSYPELIPTVRDIKMFTNTHLESDYRSENPIDYEDGTLATLKHGVPSTTRAAFTLSKFRLNIAAIHRYTPHPAGDFMIFTLDPACTNLVLQSAKGIWHTQADPYGDGSGTTRVWLLCEVKVSRILPIWITDYAAKRAMPRATTWLRPQVETAAKLWLKKQPE